MNVILKLTYVTNSNGIKNSKTKHIKLGDTLTLKENQQIESITLEDVKFIISKNDIEEESND